MCCCLSPTPPSPTDLACNPTMCPYWESNQQPFTSQSGTQSTEPHQLGLILHSLYGGENTMLMIYKPLNA